MTMPRDTYDHVYLSPHFDDAALSCGGSIAAARARGERVLVVTVCAGVPPSGVALPSFIRQSADGVRPEDFVLLRREEDRRAMAVLDADFEWMDALDAIYRLPERYGTSAALFGSVAEDDPLIRELALLARALAPSALLHAPLGVGHHVDHQIVFSGAWSSGRPVHFYEDFPYVVEIPGSLEARLAELGETLAPILTDVRGTSERRVEAIAQYPSQFPNGEAAIRAQVTAHFRQIGAPSPSERSWVRT